MKIIEFDPSNKYRIQQFNDLTFRIYRDIDQWVPPLSMDSKLIFDMRRNPFYQHSDASFFMAITNDGSPIGRLAVLNNRNFNEFNQSNTSFFCLFECFNDRTASQQLFEAGFHWASRQGLDKMIGPRGFSALEGLGLLVQGFEHRPAFGITYNPPYYQVLVEQAGFLPESDIVSGHLSTDITFPEKIHQISSLVQKRRGLRVVNFRNKRELREMIPKIKEMYNEMVQGTIGNVPLTDSEVNRIASQLIWFANPRLIKIIEKDDKAIGYLFAYPDISNAVQKTRGQVFPFGWIQLLQDMRRTKWVNINGAGIIEQYQGLGGTALLFSEMYKSVLEGGFKEADLVQIGTDNDKMQRELKGLGIDFYKTHRMYQRSL
jgi:hypothetical protein